jgi:hypothetical protein
MEFPEDADALGATGFNSLWRLLELILSDKECFLFQVSRAKKEVCYEDKIICDIKFNHVSCFCFGQYSPWSKRSD